MKSRWPPGGYSERASSSGRGSGWPVTAEEHRRSERERRSDEQRGRRRDVVPDLAGDDRRGQQADAGDEVVQAERAAAVLARDRLRDQRALAALGERGDEPVRGEEAPHLPRRSGERES